MSSIDQRVVEMKFNNKEFEARTKESMRTLEQLKTSLNMDKSAKSLGNLQNESNKFSMSGVTNALEETKHKFHALDAVAFTVLFNMTNAAIRAGKKMAGALITPLVQGGRKRALNIQQAKFQFQGLGMDVEKSMASALEAVLGTSYGLDEAAVVASQFGATGMKAGEQMTRALTGVSGVAAMTGRAYSDIGHIFTTVAGQGRLMGMQVQQFAHSGLNVTAVLAEQMGVTQAEVTKMISKGQISFEQFAESMNIAFGPHAKEANNLYTGALANLNSALARLGALVQDPHLDNMRDIFNATTPVINEVTKALQPLVDTYNKLEKMITDNLISKLEAAFKSLSGEASPLYWVVAGLGNVIKTLGQILKAVAHGFRKVFPPATEQQIHRVAQLFYRLTDSLLLNGKNIRSMQKFWEGFFSVVKVGVDILMILLKSIVVLTVAFKPLIMGILKVLGSLGGLVTEFLKMIDISGAFERAMKTLVAAISPLGLLFDGFKFIGAIFFHLAEGVTAAVGKIVKALNELLTTFDFEKLAITLGSGFVVGIIASLDALIHNLKTITASWSGSITRVNKILISVKTTLAAYQNELKARTLLYIASAIGILATSLWLLASIDPARLASAMAGITVLFTEMMGSIAIFSKFAGGIGFKKMMGVAVALGFLTTAIFVLSTTMKILSTIDWAGIAKGLISIIVITGTLIGAAKLFSKTGDYLMMGMGGFILMATAILILAKAVKMLSSVDLPGLAKGLVSIALLMGSLIGFMKLADDKGLAVRTGLSLLILAGAINLLALAVIKLGSVNQDVLSKGLKTIALLLLELAIFTNVTGKGVISTAIGLTILSAALLIFTKVIRALGKMTWDEIGRGLTVLAGSLVLIATSLIFMSGTLSGSAAMLVMATSLAILTPVLKTFSKMNLKQIGLSLLMLAGAFTVLGVAGLVLAPLVVPLLGIGAAIALIGLGAMLAGTGLLAIGAGLGAIATSGVAGAAALVAIIAGLTGLIPLVFKNVGKGILELAKVISTGGPILLEALTTILESMIHAVIKCIPLAVDGIFKLLLAILDAIVEHLPRFIETGNSIVLALLQGIADNIEAIVVVAVDIMIAFMKGIGSKVGDLVQAGWDLVIDFINGMADSLAANMEALITAFANLGDQLILGLANGIKAGIENHGPIGLVRSLAGKMAAAFASKAEIESPSKVFFRFGEYITEGLVLGVAKGEPNIIEAGNLMAKAVEKGLLPGEPRFKEIGLTQATAFMKGMTDQQIIDKAWDAGVMVAASAVKGAKITKEEMAKAGTEAGQAYIDGLNKAAAEARARAERISASVAADGGKRYFEELKQRRKDEAAGLVFWDSEIQAMTDSEYAIFAEQGGKRMGKAVIDGMRAGLDKGQAVKEGLVHLMEGTIRAAEDILEIKSPSKVFERIGRFTVEGLANGLKNTASLAVKETTNVLNLVKDALLLSDMDINPTIRPIVDLSDVERGLSSIFGNQGINVNSASIKAASINHGSQKDIVNQVGGKPAQGGEMTFVQNNYSPAALSRLDIYRQTKNQFAMLKGLVNG